MKKIIHFLYLLLFFVTPLVFTPLNSELFELPKMYFVYFISLLIFSTHLYLALTNQCPLFRPTFLTWPLIIFLLSQVVSTLFSIDKYTSIFGYYSRLNGGLLPTATYILLYFVLSVHLDPPLKNRIITISLFSGLLVAVFGILEHFGIDKSFWVQDVQNRVFASFGQPNWLAAYLCLLLPFSVFGFLRTKHSHLPYFLLSLLFFLCLLFTKSQSGFFAAFVVTVSTIFLHLITLPRPNFFGHLAPPASIAIAFSLLTLTINSPVKSRLLRQPNALPPSSADLPNQTILITPSQDIRKIVWQGAIDLWKKHPLFGTGVETFAHSYYWTRPSSHNLTSEWDFLYNKAHNEFINFLATTGIFGLTSYLVLIILTIIYCLRLIRTQDFYAIPILTALLGSIVINFAGFSVVVTSLFFYLLPAFLSPPPPSLSKPSRPGLTKFLLILALLVFSQKTVIGYYLADILYSQSQQLEDSQQYLPSLSAINSALNLRPDEPLYLIRHSDLSAKIALYYQEKNDSIQTEKYAKVALKNLDYLLRHHPYDVNLLKQTAQVYLYLATADKQYYQTAINVIRQATALAPTDAKSFYVLAKVYEMAGQTDLAIANYQQAVSLKPNYDHAYFELGRQAFLSKDYRQAKQYFQQVLTIAPNNAQAKSFIDQISSQN